MSDESEIHYSIAPGVEIVSVTDDKIAFISDRLRVYVEGRSAGFIRDNVMPLLHGELSLQKVLDFFPQIREGDIRQHLAELAEVGVLEISHCRRSADENKPPHHRLSSLLRHRNLTPGQADEILAKTRIAIFGLEGPGALLALLLAHQQIGELVLVDPFPLLRENLPLIPILVETDIGRPRQEAVSCHLEKMAKATTLVHMGGQQVTSATVEAVAERSDLLIGCFDRGFSAANHWINRSALHLNKPALFAEIAGSSAVVGPLVIAGQTACYMCYRMRVLACADDFPVAMAYEEHLDAQRRPCMHEREILPAISHSAAAIMCNEILKQLLGLSDSSIAGSILVANALDVRTELHRVLEQPLCPECKKKRYGHTSSDLTALLNTETSTADFAARSDDVISRRVGIVRKIEPIYKGNRELQCPYLFQAVLSNSQLLDESKSQIAVSGKGSTIAAARVSAVGEAIEQYCATMWDPDEIKYSLRADLDGESIDPKELVLFSDDQYSTLPYSPYSETVRLGWTRARSLVSQNLVYVPATAVLLGYPVEPEEHLFRQSSNGLAAGGTLLGAVLRAVLEMIERDAFMITWLNKLTGHRVDPFSHPDLDVRSYCGAVARRGILLHLIALPIDSPAHVFMAIAIRSDGREPAVAVGLGSDIDAIAAARSAIWESEQVRITLLAQLRDVSQRDRLAQLAADPGSVADPNDHSLLYCSPRYIRWLDFLLRLPVERFDWNCCKTSTSREKLERLVEHFASEGRDILYVDLTSPDVGKLHLHVARAIIPGYQPIHFGAAEHRLGGKRLFELPVSLGMLKTALPPTALNPNPHPLG